MASTRDISNLPFLLPSRLATAALTLLCRPAPCAGLLPAPSPVPAATMESSAVGSCSVERWRTVATWAFQHYLDRAAPHTAGPWPGTLVAAAVYVLLVYYVQGFYVVTYGYGYGMGIYLLNLLIGFLSPLVDPELDALDADPCSLVPTRGSDEFKPFIRRLPEFKFSRLWGSQGRHQLPLI